MSPAFDDLDRHLRAATSNDPAPPLGLAKRAIDRHAALFAEETHPSRDAHVLGVLHHLRHASTTIAQAIARAHQVTEAIAALAAGVGAGPVTHPDPPAAGRQEESPPPDPRGGDPTEVPDLVASLARRLSRRTNPRDKTEGFLLAGDEVIQDPLFSAEPDGRLRSRRLKTGSLPSAGVGLRPPAAKANVMDHVEAQAAAVLRRPGAPRRATLVLNNEPCDDPLHPFTCEKLLQGVLREGTTVTVYVTDGHDTWFHRVYTGTGREIAP